MWSIKAFPFCRADTYVHCSWHKFFPRTRTFYYFFDVTILWNLQSNLWRYSIEYTTDFIIWHHWSMLEGSVLKCFLFVDKHTASYIVRLMYQLVSHFPISKKISWKILQKCGWLHFSLASNDSHLSQSKMHCWAPRCISSKLKTLQKHILQYCWPSINEIPGNEPHAHAGLRTHTFMFAVIARILKANHINTERQFILHSFLQSTLAEKLKLESHYGWMKKKLS